MLARGLSWLSVLAWCLPALAQTASTSVPSPVVESGKRLFLLGLMGEARVLEGNGYCYDAAVALNTVLLEGEPEEVYYKNAELLLPENLLRVGLPYSAFVLFQRIVDAGPAHPYFAAVLPRLVELHRQLPALDAVREAMARYPPESWPEEAASEIAFAVGSWRYSQKDLEGAADMLARVRPQDESVYVRSRYLLGTVRVVQGRVADALEAFKDILRVGRDAAVPTPELVELSNRASLAAARIFFSTGQYDVALKYYAAVTRRSGDWLRALFEMGWTWFRLGRHDRAMGALHTLTSPYFEEVAIPEAYVLQAVILFANCRYEDAVVAADAMVARYDGLRHELERRLAEVRDPTDFYYWLISLSSARASEFSLPLKRIFNLALTDRKLYRRLKLIQAMTQEQALLDRIRRSTPQSGLAERLLDELFTARELAIGEAGSLARERLEARRRELRDMLGQAMRVKFEALTALKAISEGTGEPRRTEGSVAAPEVERPEEYLSWPFEGEYWRDEIDCYRFRVENLCPDGRPRALTRPEPQPGGAP